ncbi:hypothetical protein EV378_4661 [Pseudonocardia endophytica]|uniref:Uncharacterized protein n=2 Tax=Pseudonocardia endophytica TaxID=401976 RepID=A0A4R1HK81_PSEEN|nr:hypothetical protein EV378_4661 [Pseudonocardia endophytica]
MALGETIAQTMEVKAMTSSPNHDQPGDDGYVSTEELARRQGVGPIESVEDLAQPDLWESDEEYEDFLADLYASRRAGLA